MNYVIKILFSISFLLSTMSCSSFVEINQQLSMIEKKSPKQLSDYNLCFVSTNPFSKDSFFTIMWKTTSNALPYIREAKSRGLTCGVNTDKKISTRKINLWDNTELCNYFKLHKSSDRYSKSRRYS